jgi:hypothetical protein
MSDEFEGLDLDQERQVRAAQREGSKKPWPIRIGGRVICVLPVELPFEVITPLRAIDDTIALVLRQAMTLATNKDAGAKWEASELVVDMLASSPDLPVKVVEVIQQISTNLLTQEGVDLFMAAKPSTNDIAALAKGVFRYYGVSLGEASPSSDSSTDGGGTSPTTSSTNSTSTPEESGPNQEPLAS